MPLIDSALAFAITMLALSLTCSAFIELIHRAFKMREAGLKYMLEQMFDQVLVKYARPLADKELGKTGADAPQSVRNAYERVRRNFVDVMTANRAPVGLPADPGLAAAPLKDNPAANGTSKPKFEWGNIWGGRSIAKLTPIEFMERLGSTDLGREIKAAAAAAGRDVAAAEAATDAVLKDIALKFDTFGKDAATYFEGRARFLSVAVAIALAFLVHVDAIDLFRTYLQNPNATASVIAQSQAIAGQLKSMQEAVQASQKAAAPTAPSPQPGAAADDAKQPAMVQQASSSEYAKTQAEEFQKDVGTAISDARKMIRQFTDLGVPFGWSDTRIIASDMWVMVWTCKELAPGQKPSWHGTLWQSCKTNDQGYQGPPGLQYRNVWFGIPMTLNIWFCLLLGGFLIGLGAPFWYDAVTGLANISKVMGGGSGSAGASAAAPDAGKAQPVTPAGAFNVSSTARETGDAQAASNAVNPATQ
jgi:hypothetical protein